MKIVRVLLVLAALTTAAACGRNSITEPVERDTVQRRSNVGQLGSGWIVSEPDPATVPRTIVQD